MLFRFVRPNPNGSVTDIPIDAPDLHAAFRRYVQSHYYPEMAGALGVWREGNLIACVFTGLVIATGKLEPLYYPVEAPPHGIGMGMARPSEN